MAKKGGLGRGLDSLFIENAAENEGATLLNRYEIETNRNQPRKDFDEDALRELADSIAEHGIIQPLLVRPLSSGGYQLVAGERRFRASQMAGIDQLPVVIREMTDREAMEIAMVENLQREDLNPIEEAEGYKVLIEDYGLTQEEAARRVGRSRPDIASKMLLLDLPDYIREKLRTGKITAGHAKAFRTIGDEDLLRQAVEMSERGDSVRKIEAFAASAKKKPSARAPRPQESFFSEVQLALTEALGRRVNVRGAKGKGTLEIEFYSKEDLTALANALAGENRS